MKKLILLFAMAIVAATATWADDNKDNSLEYIAGSFKPFATTDRTLAESGMGAQNMTSTTYWQKDSELIKDENGDETCAALFIFINNMPAEEFNNVTVTVDGGEVKHPKIDKLGGRTYLVVHIKASEKGKKYNFINIHHDKYGDARFNNPELKTRELYEVTFNNARRMNFRVTSNPSGAQVWLDRKPYGQTPCDLKDITMGEHELTLKAPTSGSHDLTETIVVREDNPAFDYDLRDEKTVTIKASDGSAKLTVRDPITNEPIRSGKGSLTLTLPYGRYPVTVQLANGKFIPDLYVVADQYSTSEQTLDVTEQKPISFYAYQNNFEVKGANVSVDGKGIGVTPLSHSITYGKHNVTISYHGVSKSGTLKVSATSKPNFSVVLPNDHYVRSRWNPFDIDYQHRDWAVEFHYLYRNWFYKTEESSFKMSKNLVDNKHEDGIGLGISYNHSFAYGQGLRTGLHWHYFFGTLDYDNGAKGKQHEHRLYVPLQYQFMLPLAENAAIYIAGGIAGSFGLSNKENYEDSEGKVEVDLGFGEKEGWAMPERVQWTVPLTVGAHWKGLSLKFDYEFGLNNNKGIISHYVYEEFQKTASFKMRIMTFTLGFAF